RIELVTLSISLWKLVEPRSGFDLQPRVCSATLGTRGSLSSQPQSGCAKSKAGESPCLNLSPPFTFISSSQPRIGNHFCVIMACAQNCTPNLAGYQRRSAARQFLPAASMITYTCWRGLGARLLKQSG